MSNFAELEHDKSLLKRKPAYRQANLTIWTKLWILTNIHSSTC